MIITSKPCLNHALNTLFREIANAHFNNITSTGSCTESCLRLQYTGEVTNINDIVLYNSSGYGITYKFLYPEYVTVYEEYLIYDIIGMIGSIGGTLGMFLGFSFVNVISLVINYLQSLKIKFRKINNLQSGPGEITLF